MTGEPSSHDPSDFDPQRLWQSQTTEHAPMTIAEIHHKARAFESRVRRRNLIEYVGCALVIAGFLPVLLHPGSWLMQAGGALTILATLFVAWQLHRRASARPPADGGEGLASAYRQELIRQRDAVRQVAIWYEAPFVPGMTLLLLGRWFQAHATRWPLAADHLIIALVGIVAVLVFAVIWLLNQRGADRLQKRIDEL
jgi:hypothetical protein